MIHIITASNRHLYRAQLAQMHQLRRVHFVEERGWRDLTIIDGGEYDAYDDERTVYILALDGKADVLAGMRARPTDDKCMLVDIFHELIGEDYPPPKGPGVWEISRIFSTPGARALRKATGVWIAQDVILATMEWTQEAGIERLIGVIELSAFTVSRQMGWNVRMTGLPLDAADGPIIGIEVANTAADVEAYRRLNNRSGRTAHVITDADMAAFGSLEKIEAEFAMNRGDTQTTSEVTRPVDRSA